LKYEWDLVKKIFKNGWDGINRTIGNIIDKVENLWDWLKKYIPIILIFLGLGAVIYITSDT